MQRYNGIFEVWFEDIGLVPVFSAWLGIEENRDTVLKRSGDGYELRTVQNLFDDFSVQQDIFEKMIIVDDSIKISDTHV